MPKVSVIIPTYNRSSYVVSAVQSAVQQSYTDYELIVVDDGSTDDTRKVIEEFTNIVYVYQEHKGVSAARNTGIGLSRGQYIAFLDSDDLWAQDKLNQQMVFMESTPEAIICYTDEIWIRKGKRVNPMKKHAKYSGWIFEQCLPLCTVSPSSVLMRRELFEQVGIFDETLPVCEDYDLWLRVSLHYPIFLLEEKLIIKQGGHDDQLSRSMWGNDRYRVAALEKILQDSGLTSTQRKLVLEHLVRKCFVLYNGYKKREKKEAVLYEEKMHYYEDELRR